MTTDEKFMRAAIKLARRGVGRTRPNPAVGCVLVKNGRIIARGYHRRAGRPHAEIEALRTLKNAARARGATAYITLEPCSTHGRTPPCTEALIRAGIARVVSGAIDPNPKHRGRGLRHLAQAGVKTTSGVLADQCAALNPEFHHFMATGLPWVVAKCGMSLDGRLTRPPGEGQWITSPAARADAMKLRARVEAILVGAGTVRADDPALTVRGVKSAEQPRRIIWAPRTQPSGKAKVLTDRHRERTMVLRQTTLRAALRALGRHGIQSVLVEGGGHTLGQLFASRLANEVVFYVGPMLAGGSVTAVAGAKLTPPSSLAHARVARVGSCLRLSGLLETGKA
jgi:diaminohydroxyphosphoribosylaminopyrimidine deaminase/5-amino-6-(5-phosphoribosylamino)uracil reductase